MSVARNAGGDYQGKTNPGNYTFGGFGAGFWSKEACCEDLRNDCSPLGFCVDQTASQDFLFGLWMPGRAGGAGPQRYLPTGADTKYQYVDSDAWPRWGYSGNDLNMGSSSNGPPGASGGWCNQGHTHATSPNEICGGSQNWGATQLEVWRPACTACGGHGACDRSTRVCRCDAGFKRENTATCVVDFCYENDCSGHGGCDPWLNACVCDDAWSGAHCGMPPSGQFPGTTLITADWGDSIGGFVGERAKEWTLCYSSLADDATSPQVFHSQCDAHAATVTVVRNSLGYTFGGYAVNSWDVKSCCGITGNTCMGSYCVDRTTTSELVFGLGPETPRSYAFNQDNSGLRTRQYTCPAFWPAWGAEAAGLTIGTDSGAPGVQGNCNGYPGICHDWDGSSFGGQDRWGHTDVEVFYPAD